MVETTETVVLKSSKALKAYYELLVERRRAAAENPLRIGWTFVVELPPHPAATNDRCRPLPPYVHNGGTFKLILAEAPHPFQHDKQYSQVWVADVHTLGLCKRKLGRVIMKIIQPSFIRLPDPDWCLEVQDYVRPWTLWRTEDEAYKELKPLERSTVPYYFGKQRVTMPAGEDAEVLFMEYVEGKTLQQWKKGRPAHEKPEDLGDANEIYMKETKQMYKKVLLGVHAFNKLGVGHRDIRSSNIIITPSGEPVFIDFARAGCKVDPRKVRTIYRNPLRAVTLVRNCCNQHEDEIIEWSKAELAKPETSWIRC
ncbi:uncharacterized protein EV420DRAFT_1636110 [Desarmillaria tabescens]|uniref:Uncharacterized protein n=1 Tax=Armillaria tabescens TaxID=1929756 RepID=A0AA39NJZ2_ARMTA|nr:uncharacterized protein EV420DRAFT_1636110 [Desarmillaria tabescens]KAK0467079.1 hypothetical protein EV420DRAFT_1636110 [Desarmillaria tabescens]